MLAPIQAVSNATLLPERLNLAIAKRCFVSCEGCYSHFGHHEPDLKQLLESVTRFFDLGVRDVTISGGDPLTIHNLLGFLDDLHRAGAHSIKLDTVGTHLLDPPPGERIAAAIDGRPSLNSLLKRLDYIGLPLDGWSNASVSLFRSGRPQLYEETAALLDAIDSTASCPIVIINTVAHAMNLCGLSLIGEEVVRHQAVCHWNIFQFSPTDQVSAENNTAYYITDQLFRSAEKEWCNSTASHSATAKGITTEFRSVRSRLGQYLLINSDGLAWVPDERGQTISLGPVFKNEYQILWDWRKTALRLRALRNHMACAET
jgi:4Fe-4S single cluster domain